MQIGKFLKSFRFAWRGIVTVWREEQNFRIQLIIALLVFFAAWLLRLRPVEAAILILVTASVLVLELLNSLIERITDALKPRLHPYAAEIKNIAAGAVLVVSIGAVLVAVLIFWPYLAGD